MNGILMSMKKEQKYYLVFIVFFLSVIYAVPIVQAIVEYKKDKTVQAFDIVTDAVLTPYRRAIQLHELAQKQLRCSDSLSSAAAANDSDDSRFLKLLDNAGVACNDLKKAALSINRHVGIDSTGASQGILDTISSLLSSLSPGGTKSLPELKRLTGLFVHKYPSPSIVEAPLLCIKNLPHIFWNDRYLRPYEKELENNSVFAVRIRPMMQHAWYVFFKNLGSKGIRGQRHWYFYTPDVEYLVKPSILDPRSTKVDPNDKPLVDNPIETIKHFKKQLTDRGIDLLVVIVPGKPSVYPDILSKRIKPDKAASFSHSIAIIAELRKQGVDAIDLFGPFAQERRQDKESGDSMYLRQDTHWKPRALQCAAKVVARRIKAYPWFNPGTTEYAIDSVIVERVGDVAIMSSQALLGKSAGKDGFSSEKITCFQVNRILRDESGSEARRAVYKDDFHSSQILVLGDSYSRIYQTDEPRGSGWIAHLAFELSQPVASVVNDGGASTLARRSLARRVNLLKGKKLVIWEIVERDFRFGEDGWKDVALGERE
jgi:hypothetical protein